MTIVEASARRAGRWFVLCLLSACAALFLSPSPASAATTFDPVPTFGCAAANGDGTFTYFFGFTLDGTATVVLPIGPDNQFTTSAKATGQPTEFVPGVHADSFSVTTTDTTLQWHLAKSNIKVSSTSLCTNVPVVAEAPAALVMPFAAAAPFALWFATMRRRSRRVQG